MIIGSKYHASKIHFCSLADMRIGDDKLEYCKSIMNLDVIF